MPFSLDDIKTIREKTGAGVMEAKQALTDAGGNLDTALAALASRGQALAAKKAERAVKQGTIGSYVHTTGKIAALIEVLCETDFVAKTDDFQTLARELAMHVAALDPQYRDVNDLPDGVTATADQCLLQQSLIRDPQKTVTDLINETIGKVGENIQIGKFVRFNLM